MESYGKDVQEVITVHGKAGKGGDVLGVIYDCQLSILVGFL